MAITSEQKEQILKLNIEEHLGSRKTATMLGLKRDQVRDYLRRKKNITRFVGMAHVPVLRNCKYCGEGFLREKSGINSILYCSKKCKQEWSNKKQREIREKKTAICVTCGKEFIHNGAQKYCSNECRYITKICPICGKEYNTPYWADRKTCGYKCGQVATRKTHEEYYKKFSDIHKGRIVPLTRYTTANDYMTVWCIECQKTTTARAIDFTNTSRKVGCQHCGKTISAGELKVEQILKDNKIRFVKQYCLEGRKKGSRLRYDFAILSAVKEPIWLIEYDGRQHYEAVEAFGGEQELIKQQENDDVKNRYAEDNSIPLTRIRYDEEVDAALMRVVCGIPPT